MISTHLIRKQWSKVWLWMPAITAFVLPLHPRLSAFSLILWAIVAVVGGLLSPSNQKKSPRYTRSWSLLGPVLYYIGLVIGMFWTEQIDVGWFALEVKSTMIILPALFWFQVRWSENTIWIKRAIEAFLMGLGVFMVLRILIALGSADTRLWRYDGLAGPFHPSYIAAYLTLGMFLMPMKSKWRAIFLFLSALFIGLLASKAGWLVAILLLGLMVVLKKIHSNRWDLPVMTGLFFLVLGGALGDQGRMQEFIGYAMHYDSSPQESNVPSSTLHYDNELKESTDLIRVGSSGGRIQAWRASWTLLKRNPFGVGTGDVIDELVEVYSTQQAEYARLKQMNPHSAYWQALVTLGWMGGIVLLLWWGGLLWESINRRMLSLGVFTAILVCHGIFESVLELQQGVVAWVFLGLLLAQQGGHQIPFGRVQ